ncbi:MAG: FAD:protein FMN transferase [Patescibacteria group bacterium]|nr:FAD:protein FMN transferase [Patescibacteria group bacterium]MDE1988109.1 FAD:protein FMN transferase [Patescibacteria group bacterium]MDE2218434.1 FAD:protein FMN transferase [Patescibacteria group bacterium]
MKQTQLIMGMPVSVEIVSEDAVATRKLFDEVFSYFSCADEKFSPYKETSEISAINRGQLKESDRSDDMKLIFALSEETKKLTRGYFDIVGRDGKYDPSGIVKGWAILNATRILKKRGVKNFYIEAGGDIQVSGKNREGKKWRVGIENPFGAKIIDRAKNGSKEIVKTVYLKDEGIATSGTYIRGQHIYNPKKREVAIDDIVSLTVIGPNVYEADRFATAAFAMGREGVNFIESLEGFEGYHIDKDGIAAMTSSFEKYTQKP